MKFDITYWQAAKYSTAADTGAILPALRRYAEEAGSGGRYGDALVAGVLADVEAGRRPSDLSVIAAALEEDGQLTAPAGTEPGQFDAPSDYTVEIRDDRAAERMTAVAELDARTFETIRRHLVEALLAQLRHYDGTEPCKRWPDERLERVTAEAVVNALHNLAFVILPAAAIDAKARLKNRAESYSRDARHLSDMPSKPGVITDSESRRYSIIYRTVADELRKVAASL